MVNARSALGAVALLAPLAAATPALAPDVKCSVISTVYKTVDTTVKKTATSTMTVYFPSYITVVPTTTTSTTTVYFPSTVTASASACPTTSGSSSVSASATTATGQTTTRTAMQFNPTMGLNDYAKLSGRYLGTAVDVPGAELNDPVYMAMANNTHEFGSRTPANIMKYYATEPSQGQFTFAGGDQFIALAHGAGINHIRCHNLIWHSQLPSWLTSPATPWTNATLVPVLQNHVTQLVTHWGDNCTQWDVVNEAFNDGTGTYRSSVWYNTIGPAFIPLAFQAAEAAVKANNLKVKLFYNDYNIESPGAKTNSALSLVQNLTAAGIQIDGVGLQAHFIVGSTPYYPTLISTLQSFTALNVSVAYTELDARMNTPASSADQLSQFNSYKWPVQACYAVAGCVGVTIWDFDDTYSWVPSTFPGQGYADVFALNTTSNTLFRKESYDGIVDGFTGGNNY